MFNDPSHRSPIKHFIWNGWIRTETEHSTLVIPSNSQIEIFDIFSGRLVPCLLKQAICLRSRTSRKFQFSCDPLRVSSGIVCGASEPASNWKIWIFRSIFVAFYCLWQINTTMPSAVCTVQCRLPLLSICLSYLAEINTNSLAWNWNRNIWINVCNIQCGALIFLFGSFHSCSTAPSAVDAYRASSGNAYPSLPNGDEFKFMCFCCSASKYTHFKITTCQI